MTFDNLWIFTARKRSLGQGNVFIPVCHSVHRGEGGLPTPTHRQTCRGWVDPPPRCRPTLGRPPPIGRPGGVGQTPLDADPPVARPGGVGQTPPPDADPLRQSPLDADPPPRQSPPPPRDTSTLNKRAVRILLECILVKGVCFSHRDLFFAVLYSRVPGQWD